MSNLPNFNVTNLGVIRQCNQTKLMIEIFKISYGTFFTKLIRIFSKSPYEIRIAGETARHIINNKIPETIDLVSSATVHEMNTLLAVHKVSATIFENPPAVVAHCDSHSFPIFSMTCFYANISHTPTDTLWVRHAYNRLFTINSILIGFDGTIYDYFRGYDDIVKYQIRTNSHNPDDIIGDDYTRLFQYFNLFGELSHTTEISHHLPTLESVAANMELLRKVDKEIVWHEVKLMLAKPHRFESMKAFLLCDGASFLGLPDKLNIKAFENVCKSDIPNHPPLGISYLCAFLETSNDVRSVDQRLRLSKYERDLALFIIKLKKMTIKKNSLAYYQELCLLPIGIDQETCREYVLELLKFHNKATLFHQLLLQQAQSSDSIQQHSSQIYPEASLLFQEYNV